MIESSWLVEDLVRVESVLTRAAGASDHALVKEPALHLIQAGGKRLRPALVLISSRSGTSGVKATDLSAASVELVHLATLYHDDVIDETSIRRGVATVSARWGTEIAVLVGDYLFARACSLAAEAGGEVPGLLAQAIAEVCEGQVAETATVDDAHRTVEEYIATIERKTAALFRVACELGATTSGAPDASRAALATYGASLGVTFQIVDDLLDLLGDPSVTGKQPGTDLREGVFTLPVLIACEREPDLRATLERDRDLDVILPVLRDTGALEEAFAFSVRNSDRAREALASLSAGEWTQTLETVIDGVMAQVPAPV